MSDSNLKHPVIVAPLSAIITVAAFMGYGATESEDDRSINTQVATLVARSTSVDQTLTDIKKSNDQQRNEDREYRKEQREDMKAFQEQQREQMSQFIRLAQGTRNDVNLNTAKIAHIAGGLDDVKDGIEKIEDRIDTYLTNNNPITD